MSLLYVCPLSRLDHSLATSKALRVVSLMKFKQAAVPDCLTRLDDGSHLILPVSDIAYAQEGYTLAEKHHISTLLDFVHHSPLSAPLLFHCWAGISRSTAAVYIAACSLKPDLDEAKLALQLRMLSPSATPNSHLIALADMYLGRKGRMIEAIKAIGRGADAFEGTPFVLSLNDVWQDLA